MKRRASKFFVLLFSIVCVCACVFVAKLLSSAITVSGNGITQSTSFQGFEIYAVSVNKYSVIHKAERDLHKVKKRGKAEKQVSEN